MGTRSTVEVKAPTNTLEWQKLIGEVAADLLNRRREQPEVHTFAKLALTTAEFVHAETRRSLALKMLGEDVQKVLPAPTS